MAQQEYFLGGISENLMGVFVTGRQVMLEIPMPGWWLSGASVDLDFNSGRYYDSSTPNPRAATDFLSCTRASTGYAKTSTGTLISFASNALRLTDLGLLVEDARTNIAQHSDDITDAYWNKGNVTATADQAVAPDGTTSMDKLDDGTVASDRHYTERNDATIIGGTAYTWSAFVKDNGRRYVSLVMGTVVPSNMAVVVDLQTGTITQSGIVTAGGGMTFSGAQIEPFANGVYRISISGIIGSSNTTVFYNIALSNTGTPSSFSFGCPTYTGTNQSVFVWGMQLEAGAFPSSYIPTTGTSATRAADNITISGAAQTIIAAATGSIVAQVGTQAGTSFAANIVDSNGTNVLGFNASNNALASLVATLATANTGNRNAGDDKIGLAWSGAGRSIVLNGGTVATDASAQTPSSTQKLGSANATSNFIYAYVERLTLFNSKLADATLQGFTR
jgi:hypothetical protein